MSLNLESVVGLEFVCRGDDVAVRSRGRRRTSGLLHGVRLALALRLAGAPASPPRVRLSVGLPAAGVAVGRRPASAHLPPPLGARVLAAQHAPRAPAEGRQSGAARARSHRGELAVAVARPLHVRPQIGIRHLYVLTYTSF